MKKVFLLAAIVLALPMMAQDEDWRWSQTIPTSPVLYYTPGMFPDIPAAYSTPQSISALMMAMPVMPTLENIYCAEAKEKALRATYIPFQKSLDEALLLNSERSQDLDRQIKTVGNKQQKTNQRAMAQYQSNVNAGLMPSQEEMMALYMSGEIRENMSEAQMMDIMAGHFAQKWGVSKQEYLKIINLAQKNEKQAATYIQSNHPDLYNRLYAANAQYGNENVHADDPREGELDRIGDQLSELQDQLNEVLGVYKGMGTSEYRKFDDMRDQMDADWKTCPEAKQIDIIEQALEERVEAWYATVTIKGDVPYPAWWTAERKKINALVDQWNRRWAVKWLKMATSGDSQIRPIMTRAAELEVENEKLGKQGSQENFKYLMNKKLCCSIFAYMMHVIQPINDAFNFPCREHVEETGYIIVEK